MLIQVGRAGRFGTKGLALSFVASEEDKSMLKQIQERFEVDIPEMPEKIDVSTYSFQKFNFSCVVRVFSSNKFSQTDWLF